MDMERDGLLELAALVLGRTTRASLAYASPPWTAIAFAWAILLVNARWVWAMLSAAVTSRVSGRAAKGSSAMPPASRIASRLAPPTAASAASYTVDIFFTNADF